MTAKKYIYMDNASTTSVNKEVLDAMLPYYCDIYGNPSSAHGMGRRSKQAIELSRKQVAQAIGALPEEIYFTSSGTESDDWVIGGLIHLDGNKKHIITSSIEHHAILKTCSYLEENYGFSVTYLPVDTDGLIDPKSVEEAITDETVLISIMTANNEIGTIQPISEIGEIAHSHNILFHTDAVQAIGAVPINVNSMHLDFLSLSAHKFYGPKGCGALYIRKNTKLGRVFMGGTQERGMRAGTECLPNIVGLGKAIEIAMQRMDKHTKYVASLSKMLIDGMFVAIPNIKLNGHKTKRLPGNINFCFEGVRSDPLLMNLDLAGVAASGGSACTSGSSVTSHVLLALGLSQELAECGIRFSLGVNNTQEDIDFLLNILPTIIEKLRSIRTI